jgi:hypothetical protein
MSDAVFTRLLRTARRTLADTADLQDRLAFHEARQFMPRRAR